MQNKKIFLNPLRDFWDNPTYPLHFEYEKRHDKSHYEYLFFISIFLK